MQVGSNVYMTPSGAQGLAPHHDDVDVFVLQTQGRKKWKLYEPFTELASQHSNDIQRDDLGEPTHEIILSPGDM